MDGEYTETKDLSVSQQYELNKPFLNQMREEGLDVKQMREKVEEETLKEVSVNEEKSDDPLAAAREANNTWKFKDREYELHLVNKTGGISLPMMEEETQVGIIGAEFAWNYAEPFMDYMDWGLKSVTHLKDNTSENHIEDETTHGAKLFDRIAQMGFFIEMDELGEKGEREEYTREDLLALDDETQASLAMKWVEGFAIQRHFPKGISRARAMLKEDSRFFEFYIGDKRKPRHLLLFEFNKPPKDARKEYPKQVRKEERHQEGNILTRETIVNGEKKLQFAKKYFKSVEGVTLGKIGNPFNPADTQHIKEFKDNFNPYWWAMLADALVDSFFFTGK